MDDSPEKALAAAARISRQQALEPEPEQEPPGHEEQGVALTAFAPSSETVVRRLRISGLAGRVRPALCGMESVPGWVPPSPDRWSESIESQRAACADLKRKWLPDPDAVGDMDPTLNNPLCPVDDSPWAKVGAMFTPWVGQSVGRLLGLHAHLTDSGCWHIARTASLGHGIPRARRSRCGDWMSTAYIRKRSSSHRRRSIRY